MSGERSLAELQVLAGSLTPRPPDPPPWWFVEDEEGVRWAVRISGPPPQILFTSRERQVSAPFAPRRRQSELSPAELRRWLAAARAHARADAPVLRCPTTVGRLTIGAGT